MAALVMVMGVQVGQGLFVYVERGEWRRGVAEEGGGRRRREEREEEGERTFFRNLCSVAQLHFMKN